VQGVMLRCINKSERRTDLVGKMTLRYHLAAFVYIDGPILLPV